MTRSQLKQLAKLRIEEAKSLLDNGSYSGAYYLAGYSIECALKACIAKQIKANTIPDKKLILDFYTHNLKDLIKLADLENDRMIFANTNANFAINWTTLIEWNETSRYKIYSESQAKDLYNSITSKNGGILSWVQKYW